MLSFARNMVVETARALALAAFLLSSVLCPPLSASQNQLSSPTTGTVSGLQLTNNYNNALDSLNTCNSGASAPTNQLSGVAALGNCWLNTTASPYPVQWYDGANWLTPFWIDATNHVTNVKIGGGTASIASAATVDLCATANAAAAYVTITGNTTITSFGSTCKAGHIKFVTFTGVLTLTYNATSLIVPGAQNVTTAAGDQAVLMSLGSGNWQVAFYQPATGAALLNPALDVGDVIFTFLTAPPSSKYMFAYGQAISRTTYATMFAGTTITQTVTRTNGSPTLTGFTDTTQIGPNACIEGSGIPNSGSCTTQISSCTATTCTMNQNASSSGTANVTIFPNGNGDGATTFNLPNCQGVVLAGRDNMSGTPGGVLTSTYFSSGGTADALGQRGGAQSEQTGIVISQVNLPSVNFNVTIPAGQGSHSHAINPGPNANFVGSAGPTPSGGSFIGTTVGSGGNDLWGFAGVTQSQTLPSMTGTAASGGSGTTAFSSPFSTVQPTLIANCMIRVLSKSNMLASPNLAANDKAPEALAIIERRRLAA